MLFKKDQNSNILHFLEVLFAFKINELSFNRLVFYMRGIVLDISISHVGVSSVSEKMFGRLDSSHIVSVNNIDFFSVNFALQITCGCHFLRDHWFPMILSKQR